MQGVRRGAAARVRFAILAVMVAACAGGPPIETVEDVPATGFPGAFRSFAFDHDTHQLTDARPLSRDMTEMIHHAIAEAFRARGYVEAASRADADFLVEYVVALEEWIELGQVPASTLTDPADVEPYVYGRFGAADDAVVRDAMAGPAMVRQTAEAMRAGSIAIHVLDPDEGFLLWGARSSKVIGRRDARNARAAVTEVVEHTLQSFPPR